MPLIASLVTAIDQALDRWAEDRVATAVASQVLLIDERLDALTGKLDTQKTMLGSLESKLDTQAAVLNTTNGNVMLLLNKVAQQEAAMTDITDAVVALQAQVTAETDAQTAAITLLTEVAQMIRDNATAPDALNALADQIAANAQALTDAVTANTDVVPPVEPPPAP